MKKILLLLLIMPLLAPALMAQDCDCGKVRFTITDWICKGKTPAGDPIYEGKLTIQNNTDCKFTLTEILQQVGGDVVAPIPIALPPNSVYSTNITYTDVPPHVAAGASPYFIVVYELNGKRCKLEFPSEKIPPCDQSCSCSDGGWMPFVATIGSGSQKVECGHQFGLSCKDSITLKGEYLCKGNCDAKYSAVLVDAITNTVVQTYPSFSFPWTNQFTGPGSYYLEITPICNGEKCKPCRFYFTVRDCPTNCECSDAGWDKFTARIGSNELSVECGYQFDLTRCDTFYLKGNFDCKGDCNATYSAVLYDATTNAVVQTFPSFSFTWTYQFPVGKYYLVITPKCGNKECQPCRFVFTVNDCPTNCECSDAGWDKFTARIGSNELSVECGYQFGLTRCDTFYLKGHYDCKGDCEATYSAVLYNAATNAVVQTFPVFNFTWAYQFPAGSFYLVITPKCGNKECQPCRFFFTVRDCNTSCECNPNGWQQFTGFVNNDSVRVGCGHQFGILLNSTVKLSSNYLCLGDCRASHTAVLTNTVTGAVVRTWNPLLWPWDYTFTAEGTYRLDLMPKCGDRQCQPCSFFFTVRRPII